MIPQCMYTKSKIQWKLQTFQILDLCSNFGKYKAFDLDTIHYSPTCYYEYSNVYHTRLICRS